MKHSETDFLVIGAGLSGLRVADLLSRRGTSVRVLEARDRVGGRALSQSVSGAAFDLGPAWYWPGQPRMAALVQDLGLDVFEQFSSGDMRIEDQTGQIHQGSGGASMAGSLRVVGGMGALTQALANRLPIGVLHFDQSVFSLHREDHCIHASTARGERFTARQVVLALPPRLASGIVFTPAVPVSAMQAMQAVPTWMAGHAKAVVLYDAPFWRDAGLSGDAMSYRGPLVEVHDASPRRGGPFALFGFIGTPAAQRQDPAALQRTVVDQLARLFGPHAPTPRDVLIKDWARDAKTATAADAIPMRNHPNYGLPPALADVWGGTLCFAGAEVGADFGGYLEGALAAAEVAVVKHGPVEERKL